MTNAELVDLLRKADQLDSRFPGGRFTLIGSWSSSESGAGVEIEPESVRVFFDGCDKVVADVGAAISFLESIFDGQVVAITAVAESGGVYRGFASAVDPLEHLRKRPHFAENARIEIRNWKSGSGEL
ncbi:MAG: hypothetical protein ACK4X1_15845 [Terricaulis sp.]